MFFCLTCCKSKIEIEEETNIELNSKDFKIVLNTYNQLEEKVLKCYKTNISCVELYIQMSETSGIKRVAKFNDSIDTYFSSYNVIRDNFGHIIHIAEYPFSESGDWDLVYENYFDTNGNLIAFVRTSSFFNGVCSEIVRENSEYFYNNKHELIKKTYSISDGDNKKINAEKCVFNYRFKYQQEFTIDDYLAKHKFELIKR